MPTSIVLVHGGWHGAWCWRDVTPGLRAAGHDVHTPTLTGLGHRAHLLRPDIDLDVHVRDVTELLEFEDVRDAILVGHSYGGMVVTGVADRVPERLARVVYLDAFVPRDGESLFDVLVPERREVYEQATREQGDGWRVPAPPTAALGVTDPATAVWLTARLRPQPLPTFEQRVRLRHPPGTAVPATFVHCTEGPLAPSFGRFAQAARDAGWPVLELPTGHDAMVTMPERVVALLDET
jgi:pimeloyl-ACP methyl ester carboxylesterase